MRVVQIVLDSAVPPRALPVEGEPLLAHPALQLGIRIDELVVRTDMEKRRPTARRQAAGPHPIVACDTEARRDAGLELELGVHVDDVIPNEGRARGLEAVTGEPAEELRQGAPDRVGDAFHRDHVGDADIRLRRSLLNARFLSHGLGPYPRSSPATCHTAPR